MVEQLAVACDGEPPTSFGLVHEHQGYPSLGKAQYLVLARQHGVDGNLAGGSLVARDQVADTSTLL